MIYLKRFCFALVIFICIAIGVLGSIIQIITIPIWGLLYYVFTGNDPMSDEYSSIWKYSMDFINWYKNKFGPDDD